MLLPLRQHYGFSKVSDVHFSSICRVNLSLLNVLELWISSCPEIGLGLYHEILV